MRSGISSRPTIAAAKTGSVGLRTAPIRNDSIQESPTIQCARNEVSARFSGNPSSSALPGRRHADLKSFRPILIPSVKRTLNNASLESCATTGWEASTSIHPISPLPAMKPPNRKSTAVERMLRRASSERNTATRRVTAKTRSATMSGPS